MSNDAETDAALRPWATATSYTYLSIRLTLDAFFPRIGSTARL
jgi:hypothetical protein